MKQELELNKQNPFIRGYYIDPDICDSIVNEIKNNYSNLFNLTISPQGYYNSFLEKFEQPGRILYLNALMECVGQYKAEFKYSYTTLDMWSLQSGIKIQHYTPNNYYVNWHCENDGVPATNNRHLVYMTYLNTINNGGGTEFFHQNLQVKPEKGLTLIWPADWTHMHRGMIASNEDKFIITGWFIFNNSRPFAEGLYKF